MSTNKSPRLNLGGQVWAHPDLEPLLVTADTVRPHEANPRNGDIEAISASIETNGIYRPLYVQRSTGRILAGNHTYAAALGLGATRLPVIWLDVDDYAAARIMAVDNRAADLGKYDDALLLELLATIADSDSGLLGTGYDTDDMAELRQLIDAPFTPADDFTAMDKSSRHECPYCGAAWHDTASGPMRVEAEHAVEG